MSNDCRIIGTPTGIFITRAIRRLPDSFQLELLGGITASPWEYGYAYANLGHRLIFSRRSSLPRGVAVGTTLNLGEKNALAVHDYARAHPYEDVDAKALSAEVRISLCPPLQNLVSNHHDAQPAGDPTGAAPSAQASDPGMQQGALPCSGKHAQSMMIQVEIQSVCILKALALQICMETLCRKLHNLKLVMM